MVKGVAEDKRPDQEIGGDGGLCTYEFLGIFCARNIYEQQQYGKGQ